jgi:hypothetical protein
MRHLAAIATVLFATLASPLRLAAAAPDETARITNYIDSQYTPTDVRHSFHTKFGETVDCIDFFAQPGVKALAANGTPITTLPPPIATPIQIDPGLADVLFLGTPDDQGRPRSCPPGSVPVIRLTVDRIKAAGGLDAFLEAHTKHRAQPGGASNPAPPGGSAANYGYVEQDFTGGGAFTNAFATINIPPPPYFVSSSTNHSIVQTWTARDVGTSSAQTVETGTTVDWQLNGDNNQHFFIFSTNNNYGNGCYNNNGSGCLRWIGAPSAYFTPGMTLQSSQFGTLHVDQTLQVLNGDNGYGAAGWNIVGAGVYPATDYNGSMQASATVFHVGGEVYDDTGSFYMPIGSGAVPSAGLNQAAYWYAPSMTYTAVFANGSWSTTFSAPFATKPQYTSAAIGTRIFFGASDNSFQFNDNGFQWSQVGDWSPGNYKGECNQWVAVTGISANPNGASSRGFVCGDESFIVTPYLCNARSIAAGYDNRGTNDSGWDWDVGYVKDECATNEMLEGIAQSSAGVFNTILCCPLSSGHAHQSCDVQVFGSGSSPAYGTGPDWSPGYYKGVCPSGQSVAGVSRKSTGAAHAVLCCSNTPF